MHTLQFSYPDEILLSVKETEESFKRLAMEAMVVKFFEIGKLSSGLGSKMLNISRVEFLNILKKYKVGIWDYMDENDLDEDLENLDA